MTQIPTPQPAATVILVRDLDSELGVYLLRRSPQSRFMGGAHVFPGGKVDTDDQDAIFWTGVGDLSRNALSRHLHDSAEDLPLLAHAVAAIRETWEEAGVLLGVQGNGSPHLLERMQVQRESGTQAPGWLRAALRTESLKLTYSALWPWSHWIAPKSLSQRFDTRFFIAPMPADQTCRPDPRETPEGHWMTPRQALMRNADGRLMLSPPTLVTLHQLLVFPTVKSLMAALPRPDWGPALLPRMDASQRGPLVILPWAPDYAASGTSGSPEPHAIDPLPVGAHFSRIWNDGGTWRPIAG